MKKVKIFIQDGWPAERKELPPDVMPYYHIRDELVYEKGIILKGERFVIPQILRKEMLEELHHPHMGLESTLRRARETVFWPLMTTQLKDFIRRCDTCRTMDPQQQKEPLVCHEVVKQVWGKIGVDLFQHKGRDYLIEDFSKDCLGSRRGIRPRPVRCLHSISVFPTSKTLLFLSPLWTVLTAILQVWTLQTQVGAWLV